MIIKKIAVLGCLLIWSLLVTGQNKNFFFIQITDPQFGMYEENTGFARETELYEQTVSHINRLNPDFVVITGDFVHDPDDEDQIREFKRITGKIDSKIPVYMIPGNHDVGLVPTKESLKKYRANYGSDRFSFFHKGVHFIGINTSLIKAEIPKLEPKQAKWLQKILTNGRNADRIVVFGHYPFFIEAFDEPEKYSNLKTDYRIKYFSLFKAYNVSAVFSGHLHSNKETEYNGIQVVTTSAVGKPLGDAPSGFRIIKIVNGRIEHNFYGLNAVPDSVTL